MLLSIASLKKTRPPETTFFFTLLFDLQNIKKEIRSPLSSLMYWKINRKSSQNIKAMDFIFPSSTPLSLSVRKTHLHSWNILYLSRTSINFNCFYNWNLVSNNGITHNIQSMQLLCYHELQVFNIYPPCFTYKCFFIINLASEPYIA